MEEKELKRKLLVERNEVSVPKKAIFHAIDTGSKRVLREKSHRRSISFVFIVLTAILLVMGIGLGTGQAENILAKFPKVFDFFEDWSMDPKQDNQEMSFVMEAGVGYVAGTLSSEATKPDKLVRVKPGFYDVKLIEGETVNIMGYVLVKGQTFKNYMLGDNNYIDVEGEGVKVAMNPVKRNTEKFENGVYVFENQFGNYLIGEDIREGMYKVRVETDSPQYNIVVCTSNNIALPNSKERILQQDGVTFSHKDSKDKLIHLAKDALLEISATPVYEAYSSDINDKLVGLRGAENVKITLAYVGDSYSTEQK